MAYRKATNKDIDAILEIYSQAKSTMREAGIDQWQGNYPALVDVQKDLAADSLYVFENNHSLYGVCFLGTGIEPTYLEPIAGSWRSSEPYATLHRLAIEEAYRGTAFSQRLMEDIFEISQNLGVFWLRVDTHEKNLPMSRYLFKHGFRKVTRILLPDGTYRDGYDCQIS